MNRKKLFDRGEAGAVKSSKVWISILLPAIIAGLSIFAFVLLSSPGSAPSASDDPTAGQTVHLKMYTIGEKPADFDAVLQKVNERLIESIDATLDISFIPPQDATREYTRLFAGGNDFDLICASSDNNYKMLVARRAYMELTQDMLVNCAPQTYADIPPETLKQIMVDGEIYMLPTTTTNYYNQMVFVIRGDLKKKYGDMPVTNFTELDNYLYKVKNNETLMTPYVVGESGIDLLKACFLQPGEYALVDKNLFAARIATMDNNLIWLPDDLSFRNYLKTIARWRKAGIIPYDAPSREKVLGEAFISGESALYVGSLNDCRNLVTVVNKENPEFDPQLVDIASNRSVELMPPCASGIAIRNGSRYAAKSLMFIELLHNDKEIYNLLNLGIEGIHYKMRDDGTFVSLDKSLDYLPYNHVFWMMGRMSLKNYEESPVYQGVQDNWQKNTINRLPTAGFMIDFNEDPLNSGELDRLVTRYVNPMTLGAYENVDEYLDRYRQEFDQIGYDGCFKLAREQYDRYVQVNQP